MKPQSLISSPTSVKQGSDSSELQINYFISKEDRSYEFDNIIFAYVKNGTKKVSIADSCKFDLLPDMVCMGSKKLRAEVEVLPNTTESISCFTLEVSRDKVWKILDKINETYSIPEIGLEEQGVSDLELYTGRSNHILQALLAEIQDLLTSNSRFKDYWIDLKIEELILSCLQTELYDLLISDYHSRKQPDTPLGHAIQYINEHLYTKIDLKKAADKACMSKATFYRQFKHRLGLSPILYVHAERVKEAKRLLSHSDRSIADIGYQLGYCSPSHFSKQFEKITKQSPKQFRRNHLK